MAAILIITSTGAWADDSAPAGGDSLLTNQPLSTPGNTGIELLRNVFVRTDLHITETQEHQLMALSVGEIKKVKNIRKKAIQVLTPQQRERLSEIRLQAMGPVALNDPAVAKALDYTPEQLQMAKGLLAQVQQATSEALQDAPSVRDRFLKTKETREKVLNDALESLTPEQRAKFEKMRGPVLKANFADFPL
jgi:hypothetical protein